MKDVKANPIGANTYVSNSRMLMTRIFGITLSHWLVHFGCWGDCTDVTMSLLTASVGMQPF